MDTRIMMSPDQYLTDAARHGYALCPYTNTWLRVPPSQPSSAEPPMQAAIKAAVASMPEAPPKIPEALADYTDWQAEAAIRAYQNLLREHAARIVELNDKLAAAEAANATLDWLWRRRGERLLKRSEEASEATAQRDKAIAERDMLARRLAELSPAPERGSIHDAIVAMQRGGVR